MIKQIFLSGVLLCGVQLHCETLAGYETRKTVENRMASAGTDNLEGIWQFTGEGAVIAIERARPGVERGEAVSAYNIVIIESPDGKIPAGTLIGEAMPTALPDHYNCTLTQNPLADIPKYLKFTIKANDSAHLSFLKVKTGKTISLWRWIPYLFRVTVTKESGPDQRLEGCIKLYPVAPGAFNSPRYL